MPPLLLTDLSADVVQHILVRLTLAHHIARTAPTCKVVSVAARNAIKVRRFSFVVGVDKTVKLFNVNDGAVLRTFKHHTGIVYSLALLPDGRRFISGLGDATARIVEHGLAPQPALK